MAVERVGVRIEADLDVGSFKRSGEQVKQIARDTGKELKPDLLLKLELNVAGLQTQLDAARARLKEAKKLNDQDAIIQARLETNQLQRGLTEAKRELNNYVNTGDKDLSRLQAKFNQTNETIKEQGRVVGQLKNTFNDFGKSVVSSFKNIVSGVAVFELLRSVSRLFRDELNQSAITFRRFEKSLANVATLVDTSTVSIEKLGKGLQDIAKRTPVSLGELEDALYDVISAGIQAEDALGVLESGARLAVAGLGTTKEAVNLLTSAFNTFSEQGFTAEQIAQTFFLAVKNGKTTISELASGFGSLAPLAANLGVNFQEIVAAATALTTSGLSASEAYTQLQGILTAVAKNSPQSQKAAKELGIEFSTTALEAKGLQGFLNDINQRLIEQGIEGPKATEALARLFGRAEALSGALSLTNSRAESFNNILIEMTTNTDALTEAFDKQASTAAARIQRLTNELEIQRIQLGSTTSVRQGLGTFLRIQFLDTLNSVIKTFQIVAVAAVGAGRVIADGFRDAFDNVRKVVTGNFNDIINFFKTGKLNITAFDSLDFSRTQQSLSRLVDGVTNEFNRGSKEQALAVKGRNDEIEQLQTELENILGSEIDAGSNSFKGTKKSIEELSDAAKFVQKEQEEIEKNMKEIADAARKELEGKAKTSFEALDSAIKESAGNLKDLENQLASVGKELEKIENDIAKRAIAIEKELLKTQDPQERVRLEEELALARANVNEEVLAEIRRQESLSETERLLERQQALETQKAELEEAVEFERQLQEKLTIAKEQLLERYTDKFGIELQKQEDLLRASVDRQLAMMRELSFGSGTGGGSVTNNTTNVNATITNQTDLDSLVRKLS